MSPVVPRVVGAAMPFPGLRPFHEDETAIFFGRGEQIDDMLTRLEDRRFLAVVGASGSGKSSLVMAGLIPSLRDGYLLGSGPDWLIVRMRPGDDPFANLADALHAAIAEQCPAHLEGLVSPSFTETILKASPLGFLAALDEAGLPADTNVLLLADQFEEIFRYRHQDDDSDARARPRRRNESTAFVNLLLASATEGTRPSLRVVLTMRSDFLGDCDAFLGLPEAISASQFLTPRLTHQQVAEAITGPLSVFGSQVEDGLVNRVIADMSAAQDQLPLMQHALMRAWLHSSADEMVTVADYVAVRGVQGALSRHADEVLEGLKKRGLGAVVERLFCSLVERGSLGQHIRRPTRIDEVAAIADTTVDSVVEVVDAYRQPDRSFLVPPVGTELKASTFIDIGHESLIRQWETMEAWITEEDETSDMYLDLVRRAQRNENKEGDLLSDGDLAFVAQRTMPNQAWVNRNAPGT